MDCHGKQFAAMIHLVFPTLKHDSYHVLKKSPTSKTNVKHQRSVYFKSDWLFHGAHVFVTVIFDFFFLIGLMVNVSLSGISAAVVRWFLPLARVAGSILAGLKQSSKVHL